MKRNTEKGFRRRSELSTKARGGKKIALGF